MNLAARKAAARKAAFARRKQAHQTGQGTSGYLSEVLAGYRGVPVAGYMPMRSEIDPLAALAEASAYGLVGMPVVIGVGQPLQFRAWTPESVMISADYGALIPQEGDFITPEIVVVPLVAFDLAGGRLGYGGGFYDRSLQQLRAQRPTLAIGFAYADQVDSDLPLEDTDQSLDMIVTERGVHDISARGHA